MSFYGGIKRLDSNPFVFDRIFPNRVDMDEKANSDGVYVGRYVLIEYTCQYALTNPNKLEFFEKTDERYTQNVNIDNGRYHATFNGTVWQKIYSHTSSNDSTTSTERYILIARLNSAGPKFQISQDNEQFPKALLLDLDSTALNFIEIWNIPEIEQDESNEEIYNIKLPSQLHLDVGQNEVINSAYLIPDIRNNTVDSITATTANMYCQWNLYQSTTAITPIVGNSTTAVGFNTKRLDVNLNYIGKIVSDIYDILYGKPDSYDLNGEGYRPYFTLEGLDQIANNLGNLGLLGVLSQIGLSSIGEGSRDSGNRNIEPGNYFYLISKWSGADEDPKHFIENIPKVIGTKDNAMARHYYIDMNDSNGDYIKSSVS